MYEDRMYRWRPYLGIAAWITLIVIAMLGIILIFPKLMVPELSTSSLQGISPKDRVQIQTDRLKARNDARGALFQAVSAVIFLTTVYTGIRQYRISQAQSQASQQASHQQAQLAYEGLVTERFTQILGLLGSEKTPVRVGGIYALERMARDSPADRKAVRDVLIAYLRIGSEQASPDEDMAPSLAVSTPDRQAAITVLASKPLIPDSGVVIELNNIDLKGASLRHAFLEGFNLAGSDMRGTDLRGASLQGARLDGANLRGAVADKDTVWPQGFQWKAEGVIQNDPR